MSKILIIQTASIGDVILATALMEKLHRQDPGFTIDILIRKGMEPLFDLHPFIRKVILWDKRKKYASLYVILRQIRKERYDEVINIQRFFLTGLITVLSGARQTTGFTKNPWSLFFSRRAPHYMEPGVHEIDRNQLLIPDLTVTAPAGPRLYPSFSSLHQKLSRLTGFSFPDTPAPVMPLPVYYTIAPASLWPTKQFLREKWIELIHHIPSSAGIFLLGSSADHALCEEIIRSSGHPGIRDLSGSLTFLESAALMKHARMNFTNDSAPLHLASAVNAPVTVIFCSTTPEFGFGPLSDDASVVEASEPLPCKPCGLHGKKACPEKHFRCAALIRIEQLTSRL